MESKQGRYADAADAWRRMRKLTGEASSEREHHLAVAGAHGALERGDLDAARRLLDEAAHLDDSSPHLLTVAADLATAGGRHRDAEALLSRAMSAAPELSAFLLSRLLAAGREILSADKRVDPSDASDVEVRAAQRAAAALGSLPVADSPHVRLAIAELRSHYDPVLALADYREIAERHPDLLPARIASARLALADDDHDALRRELRALVGPTGALARASDHVWRCGHCGQRDEGYFWRCRVVSAVGQRAPGRSARGSCAALRERRALDRLDAAVLSLRAARDAAVPRHHPRARPRCSDASGRGSPSAATPSAATTLSARLERMTR